MASAATSVLAVDDNATIRRAIAMRLTSKGFNVVTAQDGPEALAAVAKQTFDLVLLDLKMPGMGGEEVLKQLRHCYSGTQLPIIMLAASDDKNDIAKALELGANDYIVKPGDLAALLSRIKTQLALKYSAEHLPKPSPAPTITYAVGELSLPGSDAVSARLFDGTWSNIANSPYEQRYHVLYDNTPMTCFTVNQDLEILSANRFGLQFLGYAAREIKSRPIIALYVEADRALAEEYLHGVFEQPDRLHRWELRHHKKNGDVLWMRETARVIGRGLDAALIMTCEDIDDAYRLAEKLAYHATHDELTGLPNRKTLEERLGRVIESAHSESSQHAFAIFDIDQFKIINDTCGHVAGDELLKHTARILKNIVRKRDTLARVGGDEFGILFEDCSLAQANATITTARQALDSFQFEWLGTAHRVSASVGLVAIDQQCDDVTSAISMADTACYAAKDAGRNRVHVYHPDNLMVVSRRGEMRWATRINDALRENRFELSFQPIVSLTDEDLGDHYELLIRMRDERGELIMPSEFLPAAERYNLAGKLDRWVIGHALDWLRQHPERLPRLHLCGINLSGQSFGDDGILQFILAQLDQPGPHLATKLCFEVTETAAISDIVNAGRFIALLKARGCQFALDDFGSGFASFAYLKKLPVDYLKIDGSFVREMAHDPIDVGMVRSINEIGHLMGKKTIAEFVESRKVLEILRTIGVDYAQGYDIGRPLPLASYPD